ncbi:transposase (plasmid) [Novosphingobium sp. BL-8H]|uniref:transposase n=1 Tax=Novosphingobium sp. BL-8H TaxID=3127640 RepID=UPI003757CDCB
MVITEGRVPEDWKPAKARQKDRDVRWSVKYTKAKVKEGADPKAAKPVDLASPKFGYKNHIGIDRAHGLIRTWYASTANAHDGARLPEVVSEDNTGSGVWADTAYRSKKNEAFLVKGMFTMPHPSEEAATPADARAHRQDQCEALRRRARVRRPETPHGACRSHPRHRPRPHQNRYGETCL